MIAFLKSIFWRVLLLSHDFHLTYWIVSNIIQRKFQFNLWNWKIFLEILDFYLMHRKLLWSFKSKSHIPDKSNQSLKCFKYSTFHSIRKFKSNFLLHFPVMFKVEFYLQQCISSSRLFDFSRNKYKSGMQVKFTNVFIHDTKRFLEDLFENFMMFTTIAAFVLKTFYKFMLSHVFFFTLTPADTQLTSIVM
jgi:hypothetical protein